MIPWSGEVLKRIVSVEVSLPAVHSHYYSVAMIKQFCESVNWGDLEYLIVDTPPGTSDEHLSLVENFPGAEAVLVTTPQVSLFLRKYTVF